MEIKPKNEDTHLIYTDAPTKKTKGKHRIAKLFLLAFATALLILSGAYFIFLRPLMQKPMAEPLKKDANPQKTLIVEYHLMPQEEKPKQLEEIAFPKHLEVPPLFLEAIAEQTRVSLLRFVGNNRHWCFCWLVWIRVRIIINLV